ncbi:hypothetical protein [Tenacibaculum aquimarinum]|uniref:hypothetical protein n=1 Tax=Tenacibaculum aquimarinum TaxID=2910675 RepID=UPI001F0AD15C|nr:hypothetical protein [Tenacibaculum aquimarinum]MCH3885365.1 hypothetical protein [Tenacibaculum aquimarinum]
MRKDLRNILEDFQEENVDLSVNHEAKFQKKLTQELHTKKKTFKWLYVAASIVLLIGLSVTFLPKNTIDVPVKNVPDYISLGNVSPELKTIETYYKNSINTQLSQLDLTKENKELFDGYFAKIGELTKEYKSLTDELNTNGINDNIINALIGNLQLRLQLLKRLQKQLNELKNTNQNETQTV